MDIQKEREAFERLPLAKLAIESEYVYYNKETNSYWPNEDFCPSDAPETMNFAWEAWQAAKAQAVPEGFVLVPKDQFESLNEFKALYKRAIINARKRKDQLNWAHVAGLGVGSGRAVELCKMLNIDPCATNMHEVIEAQEQSHE